MIKSCLAILLCLSMFTCSTSNAKKAATASKDFASAIVAAQQAEIQFHKSCVPDALVAGCGTITDAEHKLYQTGFLEIANCGPSVDAAIVANNTQGIKDAIKVCQTSVNNLTLLTVKNPQSKAQITAFLFSAETALNTGLAFVQ